MRAIAASILVLAISTFAIGEKPKHKLITKKQLKSSTTLCEKTWPKQKKAKPAVTDRCMQYWLFKSNYTHPKTLAAADFSLDAYPDGGGSYTAASFRRMADHVRAAYGDGDESDWLTLRAIEFFEGSADTYTSFGDINIDFLPALKAVMAGKPLPRDGYEAAGAGRLWLLRNAIYARHGRKFKHPDLNHYFYGKWKRHDDATFLPVKVNKKFKDSMLTKTDRANVRLIKKYERGEITETK